MRTMMMSNRRCRSRNRNRSGIAYRLLIIIALTILLALSTNAESVSVVSGKRPDNNEVAELASIPEHTDVTTELQDVADIGDDVQVDDNNGRDTSSRNSGSSLFGSIYNNSRLRSVKNVNLRRRLQSKDYELPDIYGGISSSSSSSGTSSSNSRKRIRSKREMKRSAYKYEKLKQAVSKIESLKVPASVQPEPWCRPHNKMSNVVFAVGLGVSFMKRNGMAFTETLRNTGFTGDIVLAVMQHSMPGFIQTLRDNDAIIYTISSESCSGEGIHIRCKFDDSQEPFSINMMRFYLYRYWALQYDESSMILLSDFRDVFFQSNPFNYNNHTWGPPDYQIAVFQESFPNKMIYRCMFNSAWIKDCYGEEALSLVSDNAVICSGVTLGTRDAILVYAYLMTQQLSPSFRASITPVEDKTKLPKDNKKCNSNGIDQGFHNFLFYSGHLNSLMDVKYFPQGEGPVNTIGAFAGAKALVNMPLTDWRILRGDPPDQMIYNWNDDPSPVVHQYDRFMRSEFDMNIGKYLKAFKGFK